MNSNERNAHIDEQRKAATDARESEGGAAILALNYVTDPSALIGRPLSYIAYVAHVSAGNPDEPHFAPIGVETPDGPPYAALAALTVAGVEYSGGPSFDEMMEEESEVDIAALRDVETP